MKLYRWEVWTLYADLYTNYDRIEFGLAILLYMREVRFNFLFWELYLGVNIGSPVP